jgi:hypothetical protein
MTPRAMGTARSFWLMGFSQRCAFSAVQVSVESRGAILDGIPDPTTVEGVSTSSSMGMRGPSEWTPSGNGVFQAMMECGSKVEPRVCIVV